MDEKEKEILSDLDEEEQKRLEKIEKLDSNQKRKKLIFAGVTVFLVALFVLGTVFGGKYILSFEGSQALPEEGYALFEPAKAEVMSLMNGLIEDTENYASVKLDSKFSVSIDKDSISVEGENGELYADMLKEVCGQVEDKLSDIYSAYGHKGSYGEDFSEFLPDFEFSADDAKEVSLTVSEENEDELIGKFSFDGCSYDGIDSKAVYEIFDLDDVEEAINTVKEEYASVLSLDNIDINYDSFDIDAYIARKMKNGEEERQLTKLVYSRKCTVDITATFIGDLSDYGTKKISFDLSCKEDYRFSKVSFNITSKVHFIEKGGSDEINRRVNSDEPVQEISIVWSSSDPDVLSVDEQGFYKGKKVSDKPVTVKGVYTYNGVEYADECTFYVRVPADSVKLSEKEVTLKVGDEFTLEATVKPEKATFKNVYWFTTDESVVTVEDGVIKAVAPGEAGVYVITFDGNYKKTCNVTVE